MIPETQCFITIRERNASRNRFTIGPFHDTGNVIVAQTDGITHILATAIDIYRVFVSDAGTPAISDPGFMLVRECVRQGVDVECLPGATAFVPALVASGLPNEKFCFEGFLPQKKGRQTRLKELALEYRTIIFYESPFRLLKTLTQFAEFFGTDRQVSVSREISKLHEETVRGSLEEVIQHFTVNEPRGEIVIVLAGLKDKKDKETGTEV